MENNKQQTALDCFIKALEEIGFSAHDLVAFYDEVIIAKELEKKQILQSLNDGKAMVIGTIENKSLEQYYSDSVFMKYITYMIRL